MTQRTIHILIFSIITLYGCGVDEAGLDVAEGNQREKNELSVKEIESDSIVIDSISIAEFKFNPGSKSITLGNQEWMDADLKTTHFRNGDKLLVIDHPSNWISACKNGIPAVWNYKNCYFYNYYAVHDPRGLAPEGWHIPTDEDWTSLTAQLEQTTDTSGKLIMGLKLNQGYISPSVFQGKYERGYSYSYSYWSIDDKNWFDIFCNKNQKVGKPKLRKLPKPVGLIREITGTYNWNTAVASAGSGIKIRCVKGELPTKEPVFKSYIDERSSTDNQGVVHFKTVVIGGREWTTKNLSVKHYRNGQPITHAETLAEWEYCYSRGIPAWCYYNNDSSTEKEQGLLYNWFAVNSSGNIISNGQNYLNKLSNTISHDFNSSGLAPAGFDIPDEKEWKQLVVSVGSSLNLKSATDWDSELSNNSGFNAVPAGHRTFSGYFNKGCRWWSIAETSTGNGMKEKTAKAFHLSNNQNHLSHFEAITENSLQGSGYSVRCIKNIESPQVYTGTFTDKRDGKNYKTIKVNNQVWMAQNLAFAPENGEYWSYKSKNSYVSKSKHGYLYDWNTANSICPEGWRLPSTEDWLILINNFGGQHRAGKEMKSTQGWPKQVGLGGIIKIYRPKSTNSSGFNALPSGYRHHKGIFDDLGEFGNWWSTGVAKYTRNGAYIQFTHINDYVFVNFKNKSSGFCVRCVREALPSDVSMVKKISENIEPSIIVSEIVLSDNDDLNKDVLIEHDEIYDDPEVVASFPGGSGAMYRWISENIKYPEIAKESSIQGRVYIEFVVWKDGSIHDVKVVRGVHTSLDRETIRVIKKMPHWSAAENLGKKVRSRIQLPVNFRLN